MRIEIEYCVPCGHLDRAVETQQNLLETYGQKLESVSLRTGEGGVFKISVDGDLVLDAQQDGYDLDAIRGMVEERLEA